MKDFFTDEFSWSIYFKYDDIIRILVSFRLLSIESCAVGLWAFLIKHLSSLLDSVCLWTWTSPSEPERNGNCANLD